MNKIDSLITSFGLDKIELKKMGSLCSVITKQTGFDYSNKIKDNLQTEKKECNVPYIQTKFFSGKKFDFNTDYYVPNEVVIDFPKIILDQKCILFSIVGASIGNVGLFPGKPKAFLGGAICVAKVLPEYNVEYIYYCTESDFVQSQIRKKIKGVGQATITIEDIREFVIPLPPIEVQNRVVELLDSLKDKTDSLTGKLNHEADLRIQEYRYYRDYLFDFSKKKKGQDYEWVELGKACKLVTGATPSKTIHEYWDNGTIPWMSSGEVNLKRVFDTEGRITQLGYDKTSTTLVPPHSVVIALAGQGKTRGKVAITEIELCTNQSLCSMVCGENIYYKYLYHYLDSKYEELRAISNGDGSRGGLSLRILSPYKIPIPSLEEQHLIAECLDKYEELSLNLTNRLINEAESHEKRYAYYRDVVFGFSGEGR